MAASRRYTLTLSCPDRVGIVAAVSGLIAQHHGWIVEASYHADEPAQRFFMRQEIRRRLAAVRPGHAARFAPIAREFGMDWRISDSAEKKRVVILVSKQEHCLDDLLHAGESKELDVEIPCVISNHETFRGFVEWHGIPFHHVPVMPDNKDAAFAEVAAPVRGSARRHHGARALHADPVRPSCAAPIRGASSTSTTASCPLSSAPSPITRPTRAASS